MAWVSLQVVGGDCNFELGNLVRPPAPSILAAPLVSRLVDVDLELAAAAGGDPVCSFQAPEGTRPTRIDCLLVNTNLATLLRGAEVLARGAIPGHTPVRFHLHLEGASQRVLKFVRPSPILLAQLMTRTGAAGVQPAGPAGRGLELDLGRGGCGPHVGVLDLDSGGNPAGPFLPGPRAGISARGRPTALPPPPPTRPGARAPISCCARCACARNSVEPQRVPSPALWRAYKRRKDPFMRSFSGANARSRGRAQHRITSCRRGNRFSSGSSASEHWAPVTRASSWMARRTGWPRCRPSDASARRLPVKCRPYSERKTGSSCGSGATGSKRPGPRTKERCTGERMSPLPLW